MRTVDQREEQVFAEAIELDSVAKRRALVRDRCGNDTSLLRRVEQLVDFHFRSDFLLDSTPGLNQQDEVEPDDDLCGMRVGPYDLVRRIGEGGMGVVYLAEQRHPVQRRVAVKVIKPGMDTRQVIARFEAERQALAMMEHPSITHVYDAGTTDAGRPYFVMEIVHGSNFTDYCDTTRLSLRERLGLFVQVCEAVQHAHQKGIIHRDIKPSNILVTTRDGRAVPKVIDFGIAKATQHPLVDGGTQTGCVGMLGTPDYMSPEQADASASDVDTRSDIYSLGAMLYELVSGETPFGSFDFRSRNLVEIREIIQTRDPERPSAVLLRGGDKSEVVCGNRRTELPLLHRRVRRDLDWIILKSLARDRNERYDSAASLAREIERYLVGDPVEAARPTLAYKFSKFASRYRGLLLAAAIVGLMMTASSVFSILAAVHAQAEADRAVRAEMLSRERLEDANLATQDAEFARQDAANSEQTRRETQRKLRNQLALSRAVGRFNRMALDASRGITQPDPVVSASNVPRTLSLSPWMAQQLGDLADVVVVRVGPIAAATHGPSDPPDATAADILLLRLILAEQQTMFGMNDLLVADTHYKLGYQLLSRSAVPEAVRSFRQSLVIRQSLAPDSVETIVSLLGLGTALARQREHAEARRHLTRAIHLLAALPDQGALLATATYELEHCSEPSTPSRPMPTERRTDRSTHIPNEPPPLEFSL